MKNKMIYIVNASISGNLKNIFLVLKDDTEYTMKLLRDIIKSAYNKCHGTSLSYYDIIIRHGYRPDITEIKDMLKSNDRRTDIINDSFKNIIHYDEHINHYILTEYEEPNYIPIKSILNNYKINILLMESKMSTLFKDKEKIEAICNLFKDKFFVDECRVTVNTGKIKDIVSMEDSNNTNTYYILLFDNIVDISNIFDTYKEFTYRDKYSMFLMSSNLIRKISVVENKLIMGSETYDYTRYKTCND